MSATEKRTEKIKLFDLIFGLIEKSKYILYGLFLFSATILLGNSIFYILNISYISQLLQFTYDKVISLTDISVHIASLITKIPFVKNVPLIGTLLNFISIIINSFIRIPEFMIRAISVIPKSLISLVSSISIVYFLYEPFINYIEKSRLFVKIKEIYNEISTKLSNISDAIKNYSNLPKSVNLPNILTIFSNFISFIPFYQAGYVKGIFDIVKNNIMKSQLSKIYTKGFFPLLALVSGMSVINNLSNKDNQGNKRGILHNILNDHFKTFIFSSMSTVGCALISFVGLPIAPILLLSAYTALETGILSAVSAISMIKYDREGISTFYQDTKKFLLETELPLINQPLLPIISKASSIFGGMVSGSFLFSKIFTIPSSIVTFFIPTIYTEIKNNPDIVKSIAKSLSSIIGSIIGGLISSDMADKTFTVVDNEKPKNPGQVPAPTLNNNHTINLNAERSSRHKSNSR